MSVGKPYAIAGKTVHIRCAHVFRSIAFQIAIAKVIGINQYHVWTLLARFSRIGSMVAQHCRYGTRHHIFIIHSHEIHYIESQR